jgi:hypothetical protein
MNKTFLKAGAVVLSCMSLTCGAVPVGTSNSEIDYTISAQSFHNWCWGIFSEGRDREVDVPGANGIVMTYQRFMGYVGYDILPGLTFYATAGAGSTDLDDQGAESAFEYGAGLNLNLLDHEVLDPTMFEDRLRINGNVQVTFGSADWERNAAGAETLEWQEVSASLVIAVVNDCTGDKFFSPFSISLFAGPIYSEYLGGDLEVNDEFGVIAGMEVFYGLNITLSAGIEAFKDDVGYVAGLHFRF